MIDGQPPTGLRTDRRAVTWVGWSWLATLDRACQTDGSRLCGRASCAACHPGGLTQSFIRLLRWHMNPCGSARIGHSLHDLTNACIILERVFASASRSDFVPILDLGSAVALPAPRRIAPTLPMLLCAPRGREPCCRPRQPLPCVLTHGSRSSQRRAALRSSTFPPWVTLGVSTIRLRDSTSCVTTVMRKSRNRHGAIAPLPRRSRRDAAIASSSSTFAFHQPKSRCRFVQTPSRDQCVGFGRQHRHSVAPRGA
jgi:hypothetical protein